MNIELTIKSHFNKNNDLIKLYLNIIKKHPEYKEDYKKLYGLNFEQKLNFFYSNYNLGYEYSYKRFLLYNRLGITLNLLIDKLDLYIENDILKSNADENFLNYLNYVLNNKLQSLQYLNIPLCDFNLEVLPIAKFTDRYKNADVYPSYMDTKVKVLKDPEIRNLSNKWIKIGAFDIFNEVFNSSNVSEDLKLLIKYLYKLGIVYNKNFNFYCVIPFEEIYCFSQYHNNDSVLLSFYIYEELLDLNKQLDL